MNAPLGPTFNPDNYQTAAQEEEVDVPLGFDGNDYFKEDLLDELGITDQD